jgi:hypothetical protein
MKWNARHTEPEIKEGSTRLVRRFAWLPEYVAGQMVWLEDYEILQGWVNFTYTVELDGEKKTFVVSKWIELSKRIK